MSVSLRGQVISTEREDGTSVMAPDVLIFRFPRENITSKSLFIVQPQEQCVVIIQGQVAGVLPPGTHNIQSPANVLSGFLSKFRYNALPYDTVAYFVSTTRHEVRVVGLSQTDDLVPLEYEVAVYFRVQNPPNLVINVQFSAAFFKDSDLATYIAPVIDQEVSSVLNQVKLTDVYKKFMDISTAVTAALKSFLGELGVELISVRVTRLIPQDPELRRIIQLRDLGIQVGDAVRLGLARVLAEKNDPSSVNMAIGVPYYPQLSTLVNLPDGLVRLSMGKKDEGQSGQGGG
ncbi:SPFH domain-containing protein [Acidianus brierleyi]|uniref:Band 7 domain-containing protein n=1 Tax=Acidianus brierleyi TaxID=41673 RepID=A0A2U9IDQ4_9CREN|nr:SPFH domain-containing protein [Acidianus brierleyi]AWR94129.1 SPFH domain-containing protein [Acidianus brierleyi]